MKVLFWIIAVFLTLMMVTSICGAVSHKNSEREIDLMVGTVVFGILIVMTVLFKSFGICI